MTGINTSKLAKALNTKFDARQEAFLAAMDAELAAQKITDPRWRTYMLVTNWHECRFKPIREGDWKGEGITDKQAYDRVTAYCKKMGRKNYAARHPVTKQSYYGRGGPQLTHYDNYLKQEKRTGLPLTTQPDLVLQPEVTAKITVGGMVRGDFARDKQGPHNLARYFNNEVNNAGGARHIVNGTDKAELIAGYYRDVLPVVSAAPAPKKSGAGAAAGATVVVAGGAAEAARQYGIDWRIVAGVVLCVAVLAVAVFVSHRMTRDKANG